MFSLADNEQYCDHCVKIVSKPHECEVLKRKLANAEEREKQYEAAGIRQAPGISWKCGGATIGYRGGPGTGLPKVAAASNPGNQEPTLAMLGLSNEHGRQLGIK